MPPLIHLPPPLPHYYHKHHPPIRIPTARPPTSRPFTTTRPLLTNDDASAQQQTQTHYETLSLLPSATPQEIKRQFFSLSKSHHPDKNPNDPTASARFVKISEAYHVLSSPDQRARYDATLPHAHHGRPGGAQWYGRSHSSAQTHAGGRPATGLNKKRGTFKGPPPSFFKAGGYGDTGAKRAAYEHHYSHPHASSSSSSHGSSHGGGGYEEPGSEVPHFDEGRHKRMHDSVNEHILGRRRRRAAAAWEERVAAAGGPGGFGPIARFALVSGMVGVFGAVVMAFSERDAAADKKRKRS
ncbi:DnaJ-domain-containing protein [Aaosphaeria arxii CBS 175.79]|uniref:DnaJ-domain-containing protein n=1 Tax=Aaosphaeria arxii CBS 175.79 TaxID=1450172 RepID=A0A6A5Y8Z9_9PLEO|nr:DnaJ-domain-containing protein [Aaosphaeria arxii CBS 175.79]KAF2021487.1 DnaJ-domain-containing protein [Aaosphaeria arxii CBS 175.79]